MAIKELKKVPKKQVFIEEQVQPKKESKIERFISKGGTLTTAPQEHENDHRLTLRIPKWLMERVDVKRKQRVGKISRNLWILEVIEKAADRDLF